MNLDVLSSFCTQNGISINDNQISQLCLFEKELLNKNKMFNLTAITDSSEVTMKHFIDSLYILKFIDLGQNSSCIDIGCGAGFPGIPLYIFNPNLQFTYLDSNSKKVNFINQFLKSNGMRGQAIHGRAEEISHNCIYREKYDFSFSRALANQNIANELCTPFVKVGGRYITLKTKDKEIIDSTRSIKLLGCEIENIFNYNLPNGDKRCIGVIYKRNKTPIGLPRKFGIIKNKPL